jgi:anti-sigma factor RsiW
MRHASFEAQLTALALGELRGEERLEVESRVEQAPELRREVEAIQDIGGLLEAAYAEEAAAAPRQDRRRPLLRVALAAAAMALAASLLLVAWPRGGGDGAAAWDRPHDEVAVHASDGGPG